MKTVAHDLLPSPAMTACSADPRLLGVEKDQLVAAAGTHQGFETILSDPATVLSLQLRLNLLQSFQGKRPPIFPPYPEQQSWDSAESDACIKQTTHH